MKPGFLNNTCLFAAWILPLVTQWANAQEKYLLDVQVHFDSSKPATSGFERIGGDLNAGAGGAFVYLYAKFGVPSSPEQMIYDLQIVYSKDKNVRAGAGYTTVVRDLNAGAGGPYIYLAYSRLPSNGHPISMLMVSTNKNPTAAVSNPNPRIWTVISTDLNKETKKNGDPFIFLKFQQPGRESNISGWTFLNEDAQSGSSYTKNGAPEKWLVDATRDWMSKLPDNTSLGRMSIPGTHDSGAMHGGLAAECQEWTIKQQLDAGIRYFDIRCRPTKDAFAIHHGQFFQQQMLGDVLNAMKSFLQAHPNEVIVMRWKTSEHNAEAGSLSELAISNRYIRDYEDYFLESDDRNPVPTLGDSRGKIVILRDGDISSAYGLSFGNSGIQIQDFYKVFLFEHREKKGSDWATLPSKKDEVKLYIDAARNGNQWVANHLSGAVGMAPPDVARATNGVAYDHIGQRTGKQCLGTVIMDFPGDKLIYRIIKSNFN